jgi:GDP-L-fucose synthase
MKKQFKIFVTGHNGMVGKSVVSFFKKKKIGKLILVPKNKLNLENYDKVDSFIKKQKPDVIINCAGKVGGILPNSRFPIEFLNINILIQSNLINVAYKNKVKHFVNLGSSCIYPKNAKQPIKEEYLLSSSLEKTNEAYALAKIVGLKMCEYYNKQYNTSYFTLMPCNLYGENDNFNLEESHFIPALIRKIVNSEKENVSSIEILGTGKPKREVMHVDDLSSAIYFLVKKKLKNDSTILKIIKKNSLINVGSNIELTIKQFAEKICKIEKINRKLIFNKSFPDGTKRKILDIKILSNLGWRSKVSLKKGLSKTIKWYKENYL